MKYTYHFNPGRCVACGACAVACMDQNDISLKAGGRPRRRVAVAEYPESPGRKISYRSLGCMHCAGAPCAAVCPAGCLRKNGMGLTEYDPSACIGCGSCAGACPFGAPAFPAGGGGKMEKCDGCQVRLEHGLEPACVRVCPTGALACIPEELPERGYAARDKNRA